MVEVRKTDRFAKWLDGLADLAARARVQVRIERLASGNPGDVRAVGEGVWSFGSTTAPATGCTSSIAAGMW